jgi:hypothetical protein
VDRGTQRMKVVMPMTATASERHLDQREREADGERSTLVANPAAAGARGERVGAPAATALVVERLLDHVQPTPASSAKRHPVVVGLDRAAEGRAERVSDGGIAAWKRPKTAPMRRIRSRWRARAPCRW